MTPAARAFIPLLLIGLGLVRCDGGGNSSDGQSSWLAACERSSDCEAPYICLCGICATGCDSSRECTAGSKPSACVEVSSANGGGRCKVGLTSPGLCLPGCTSSADCGTSKALECVARVCTVRDRNDADAGVSEAGGKSSAAGGSTSVTDGSAPHDSSTGGTASGGPRDATPDAYRPTKPGAAPANPYGAPIDIDVGFNGTCGFGGDVTWGQAGFDCLDFGYCTPRCDQDEECPSGGSGSAVPTCATGLHAGTCSLACEHGEKCPTGMICDVVQGGSKVCAWVAASTSPTCPAHCRMKPVPRDCPNWCAAAGVACDEAKGVHCCDGFTCTSGGYCLENGR